MISRVFLPVSHHRGALSEAFAAEVADVRSLAGVSEPVNGQGVRARERFPAVATVVRALAGVHAIVQSQSLIVGGLLAAEGAQKFSRMNADVIPQQVLRGEGFLAYLALVVLPEDLQDDTVDRTVVSRQRGLLQESLAAELADESLYPEMTDLVLSELAVRHEAPRALVALVVEVLPMHPTNVVPHADSARRRVVALLAAELRVAVQRHVGRQRRFSLEQLLADVAPVRFHGAVVHRVNLQSALSRKTPTAGPAIEANRRFRF